MPELINQGHIYIAQAPLYRVAHGSKFGWAYSDEEKDRLVKEYGQKGTTIQRYKGLGEMNADQLADTTMKPAHRSLLKVRVEDSVKASELFNILMGEEVEPRRLYIQEHAAEVVNLDV
jgi:DNA gyrase subunit B